MESKRSLFSAIPSAIIAGIIAGMIVYFGLNFGGFKEYQAQAKVVTTDIETLDDAANTAGTYAATINSPKIKQRTLESLEIDWNVGKLDSKLSLQPVQNTAIIDIIVEDTNKLRAEDIADQYADYAVRVLNNIYNSGASIMEYSYGSAAQIDNTPRYALIGGGLGFLLWLIIDMLRINSHNKKIEKAYLSNQNREVDEVKEVREVKPTPTKTTSKQNIIRPGDNKKTEVTTYEASSNDDISHTQVVNSAEVRNTASSKYEILGKIPSYEKGELDV